MKLVTSIVATLAFAFPANGSAQVEPASPAVAQRTEPWPDAVLETFARIPVQDDGRIKPLDTFARFELLKLSGYRTLTIGEGDSKQKLTALEWLLDVLYFPAQTTKYKVFLVEDYEVLSDVGINTSGLRKRDRYSFEFLATAGDRILEKARDYYSKGKGPDGKFDSKLLTPLQNQVIRLAGSLSQFHRLQVTMEFARRSVDVEKDFPTFAADFPGRSRVSLGDFVPRFGLMMARYEVLAQHDSTTADSAELRELTIVLDQLHAYMGDHLQESERTGAFEDAGVLRLIPPPAGEEAWMSPAGLMLRVVRRDGELADQLGLLAQLTALPPSTWRPFDAATFERNAKDYETSVTALAMRRGEGDKIGLEVFFYGMELAGIAGFFEIAKWVFFAALIVTSLMWLAPRFKLLYGAGWVLVLVPLVVLVAGIVIRCVLRGRPPVSTLYETTLFISAVAVIAALIVEWLNRERIALFLAAVIGYAGMFLAGWYETVSGTDTMPQLEAVLDTNFWLSTHVTTVTIGYAAGLLAGVIAHVYIIGKIVNVIRRLMGRPIPAGAEGFFRNVGRMVYGAIGFSLVFSTVGTILGGVWANDSWGRFWGWDPKENGALMIVIMNLILLHGRLGGFIRDFGTALGAVVLAIIVCFSWFHVNVLGVGLHSYGFDERIANLLRMIYGVEVGVIALGLAAWVVQRTITRNAVVS